MTSCIWGFKVLRYAVRAAGVSVCLLGVVHASFPLTILFTVFAGIFLEVC